MVMYRKVGGAGCGFWVPEFIQLGEPDDNGMFAGRYFKRKSDAIAFGMGHTPERRGKRLLVSLDESQWKRVH